LRCSCPDADVAIVPCVVGLGVRTTDGNAEVGGLLSEEGIDIVVMAMR